MRVFALAAAALVAMSSVSEAVVTYEFGTEFSGTFVPLSGDIVVTIDDGGSTGSVDVTIDTSNLDGNLSEYVSALYLNLDPALNAQNLSWTFSTTDTVSLKTNGGNTGVSLGTDAFQADGDGLYDILIEFDESGNSRFEAGESATITFTLAGLTEEDFEFLSAPAGGHGPFEAALRVRGAGPEGEDSGWYAPGQDIPEPASLALMGLGGLLAGYGVRRRKKKSLEEMVS